MQEEDWAQSQGEEPEGAGTPVTQASSSSQVTGSQSQPTPILHSDHGSPVPGAVRGAVCPSSHFILTECRSRLWPLTQEGCSEEPGSAGDGRVTLYTLFWGADTSTLKKEREEGNVCP